MRRADQRDDGRRARSITTTRPAPHLSRRKTRRCAARPIVGPMRIPASSGSRSETILDNWVAGFRPASPRTPAPGVARWFWSSARTEQPVGIDRFQAGDHVIDCVRLRGRGIIEPTDVEAAYSAPSGYPSDGRYLNLVTCTSTAFGAPQ